MPSSQTANYKLNLWDVSDRVHHEDFNEDNRKIDEALKALNTGLSGKASSSALTSLQTAVNGKASQAALDALTATVNGKANQSALEALQAVVSEKGNCRFEVGSYVGVGDQTGYLTASFMPRVILILGSTVGVAIRGSGTIHFLSSNSRTANVTWSGSGITWKPSLNTTYPAEYCNAEGTTYYFAALG